MDERFRPLQSAVESPGVLGILAVGMVFEAGLRILLVRTNPWLFVVTPPVLLAPFACVAFAAVRRDIGVRDAWLSVSDHLGTIVVGTLSLHVAAVLVGFALFLVIDTALRMALYWLGYGSALTYPVQIFTPLFGIPICTLGVYAILVPLIEHRLDGVSRTGAAWAGWLALLARPRSVLGGVVAHLALGAGLVGILFAVLWDAGWFTWRVELLSTSVLLGIVALVGSWAVLHLHATRVEPTPPSGPAWSDRRVAWVTAVTVLVVVALVTVAGVVRVAETRPTAVELEALPEAPAEAYETAVSNTDQISWEMQVVTESYGSETVMIFAKDRVNRRIRVDGIFERVNVSSYWSAGTGAPLALGAGRLAFESWELPDGWTRNGRGGASPNYFVWAHRIGVTGQGSGGLPNPDRATSWTVVDSRGSTRTLALAESQVVQIYGSGRDGQIERASLTVTVDDDRDVVTGGELRIETTQDGEESTDLHTRWEIDTGITVQRPAELGPPRPSEWLWKMLAY